MKNLFLLLVFQGLLFSLEIGSYSAKMAKDTYLEPDTFVSKHEKECKQLILLEAESVPFYLCQKENNIWLAVFRGSKSISNWVSNLTFTETTHLISGANIHTGFYQEATQALAASAKYLKKGDRVISIGHSLGGAVALLYAYLLDQQSLETEVISFGAPPVGNDIFIQSIKHIPHWRYYHVDDTIPKLSQEEVDGFKSLLQSWKSESVDENVSLRDRAIDNVSAIKYEYVHHGKALALNYECNVPFSTEAGWGIALAEQLFKYHAMPCYIDAIENSRELKRYY